MSTALSRIFSVALGAALLVVGAAPVRAATLSYTDTACSSFAVTGSAPNFTLVCSKLACSLAANPASPLSPLTAATTLTTSCSPSGTYSYAWSKSQGNDAKCPPAPVSSSNSVGIAGNGQAVSGCVYQVDVNGGANGNGVATVSLDWTANLPPPVAAPTGCTLSPSATTLPAGGGALIVTASCSGGGVPTNFDWTGGTLATSTTSATQSTNITATTTFTVTPRNSGGSGKTASATVTVTPVIVGGGGFCNLYPNVLAFNPVTWGQGSTFHSSDQGGFAANGVWVFQITVPPGTPSSASPGRFAVAEFQGLPATRQITISTQACDFRFPDYRGVNGPFTWSNGNSATVSFMAVTSDQVGLTGNLAGLVAGQTYYINIRNWSLDLNGVSCGGQCNAIMNYDPSK